MSVVITTFNTDRYLPETLDSVFAQSHDNLEIIVVDDGSTDDTVTVAREHGDRIDLVERAHEGLGPARNAGLARATGDYIAFLDSDDLWHPDTLRVQLDVARRHPESGMVVCDAVELEDGRATCMHLFPGSVTARLDASEDGEVTGWMYDLILAGNPIGCPAQALVPRHVVEAIGPVSVSPHGAQDYEYSLRIARRFPVTFHRATLVRWRSRADSLSGRRDVRGLRWAAAAVAVYQHELEVCEPAERDAVRAAMTRQARGGIAEAARARTLFGTEPDPDDLRIVARVVTRDPLARATLVVLALPSPIDRALLLVARSTRRAIRRAIHRTIR